MKRRKFFQYSMASLASATLVQKTAGAMRPNETTARTHAKAQPTRALSANHLLTAKAGFPVKTKISLNAYSFNNPLRSGEMTLEDMLDFAAKTGFEGVDLTGYYFPGYPKVPSDAYIFQIKYKAFRLGLEICGSGVRCDFAQADPKARKAAVDHVKEWIKVAAKLGGQTLRIFAGNGVPDGYKREEVFGWIVDSIHECAEQAAQDGIFLAIQNHNDFLKTADQVEELLNAISSEWVGLMLDIGSYRSTSDTYAEIRQTIKYAFTWQIKEEMYVNGQAVRTDLDKIKAIIDESEFRGYLPIETLGPGDPKQKIAFMFDEVKKRFG